MNISPLAPAAASMSILLVRAVNKVKEIGAGLVDHSRGVAENWADEYSVGEW